jgi:hypothetical protein
VGFRLLSGGVVTVVEGIYVLLNIAGGCRCAKVFELLVYLSARACTAVLPRGLRTRNLLLLEGPSCLKATVVYRASVEFPLGRREISREEW